LHLGTLGGFCGLGDAISKNRASVRLLLVLTVGIAVVATIQAVAVSRAASLLPPSWNWAADPTVAWLVVGGTTLLTVGLARALVVIQVGERRREDRHCLTVEPEPSFQTTIGVHRPPSVKLRWTPLFRLSYTGSRVLTVLDIVPLPPVRWAEGDREVQLVRTKTSSRYKAHPTFGALAHSHRVGPDEDFYRVAKWPLLLRPGTQVHIAVEQEYELHIDGRAMSFASHDDALAVLGPYFDLQANDHGGYWAGTKLLPTRVVCADDEWELNVAYALFPVGVSLKLPDESSKEIIDQDELY
jgi:hypothetical protein